MKLKLLNIGVLLLPSVSSSRFAVKNLRQHIGIAGTSWALCFSGAGVALADGNTNNGFSDQIALIKSQRAEKQKLQYESTEQALIAKELQYPPNKLIARGSITLSTEGLNVRDFPYGLESAALINDAFDKDSSALILLAVGREGPPLAAKKYPLKDITFPFVFEITDEDLVFPYTPNAWAESPFSKDTIAVTAIINSEGKLALPIAEQRIGYATSEPVTIAGTNQRSPAEMVVVNKIDSALYSAEELKLLSAVDEQIDAHKGAAAVAKK